MTERAVRREKQVAKQRKRSGQARSYMVALAQLAAENGHDDWPSYEKELLARPASAPDFRIRLVPPAGDEKLVLGFLQDILSLHGLDAAQWHSARADEREQFVLDFALWSMRKRGDFTVYQPEILESNEQDGASPIDAAQAQALPDAGSGCRAPDFIVELESRATGKKEEIGVHLADLLELHGMSQAEWDEAGQEEQESLVEEAALWEKRSKGDLGGYFTEVVSGLDQGEGNAPR